MEQEQELSLIDVGANLTCMFALFFFVVFFFFLLNNLILDYRSYDVRKRLLKNAKTHNVTSLIITGTSLQDSKMAINYCRAQSLADATNEPRLYATVGCHPTQSEGWTRRSGYFDELARLALENTDEVVAVGECGLDWDRLQFADRTTQLNCFEDQLRLPKIVNKPLFLHCRNAFTDFVRLLRKYNPGTGGVVHSFTGSKEEAKLFTDMGYYISVNGCGLRTQENIDTMCSVPLERLLIETDCPWCWVKPKDAGFKYIKTWPEKTKQNNGKILSNEPATLIQILEIVAGARNQDMRLLAAELRENTNKLFGL